MILFTLVDRRLSYTPIALHTFMRESVLDPKNEYGSKQFNDKLKRKSNWLSVFHDLLLTGIGV